MSTRVLCVNIGSRTAKLSLLDVAAAGEPALPIAETERPLDALADSATLEPFESTAVDLVAYRVVRIRRLPATDAVPFDREVRAEIAAAAEYAPLHTRTVLAAFDALIERS